MLFSGALLLVFVGVHLPHLTTGHLDAARFTHGAVYQNLYGAFRQWPFAAFYLVAMGVLGWHIYHGAWSMFQSLGVNNPKFNAWRRYFAIAFAAVTVIANVSFPVAVLAGIVS